MGYWYKRMLEHNIMTMPAEIQNRDVRDLISNRVRKSAAEASEEVNPGRSTPIQTVSQEVPGHIGVWSERARRHVALCRRAGCQMAG